MTKDKYIDDLRDIREMMNRSSRFISLSGLSGVFAGVFALIGAYLAYITIYSGQDYLGHRIAQITVDNMLHLLLIAGGVIICSVTTGIYFTTKKAKQKNQKIWDQQVVTYLGNLMIPLATGGIFCIILLLKGYISLIAPLTLIFYGLALVNGSHYTLKETKGLGILQILLGLLATYFIGYGLVFWALGFGVLHIIYGIFMHFTDKRS